MIILLSPAKTIDFNSRIAIKDYSVPNFKNEVLDIIRELKNFSPEALESLMKINPSLAELNFFRIQKFDEDFLTNSKQAIYVYNGEVYRGLNAHEYTISDMNFATKNLRILSGLYGILKPLDLIKEHRLEMSTKLQIKSHKNLYEFWGNKLTNSIIQDLKNRKNPFLINLASKEYTDAIDLNLISKKFTIITPIFKDFKNRKYKNITIYSKHCRGLMASYIIKNQIDNIDEIKKFNLNDYKFIDYLSNDSELFFFRG